MFSIINYQTYELVSSLIHLSNLLISKLFIKMISLYVGLIFIFKSVIILINILFFNKKFYLSHPNNSTMRQLAPATEKLSL